MGSRSPRRGQHSPPSGVRPGGAALTWLAGYPTGGMPLPDEFDRLARHLDGQIGFLYRDAADTADQVADVEQEPELPGRPLGYLIQAL